MRDGLHDRDGAYQMLMQFREAEVVGQKLVVFMLAFACCMFRVSQS